MSEKNLLNKILDPKKINRICLKLSGEVLMGDQSFGLNAKVLDRVALEIQEVYKTGIELCVVIGGGNIFRGTKGRELGINRVNSDSMGMIATIINALTLESKLTSIGVKTRVQSAVPMEKICESYARGKALSHIRKGRVVIFAAGLGAPYFTTDTTSVLRASEMNCDLLLKGTKFPGIYDKDPEQYPDAKHYSLLSYDTVVSKQLKVMDMAAISLAKENQLPIMIFSIKQKDNFAKCLRGEGQASLLYH